MEKKPAYKTVPDDERYAIVNEGSGEGIREITANLRGNELKITALKLEDCPLWKHPSKSHACVVCGFAEP